MSDYSNATADFFLQCKEGVIVWTSVIVATFVLGSNGIFFIVLDMIQKHRKGIPFSPNDVFISNLVVTDGIYLFCLLPKFYNYLFGHHVAFQAFFTILFSFNFCGRPLFMACICLDFYIAVVHPVTYQVRKSLTPRVLMAVGVWTVTVAHGCYFATRNIDVLMDLNPILFFALTLPIILFCDFCILWTLMSSNAGGRKVDSRKRKALQLIINNLIITFICYIPPIIAVSVSKFLSLDEIAIRCLVVIPLLSFIAVGNTASAILHLKNLGKLDWLKCWMQK